MLDKLIRQKGYYIRDLRNKISGIFHTNQVVDMTINNMNDEGEDYCLLTKDGINGMGFEYFEKFAHPYTIQVVGPRFQKFYELADDEKIKGDFQLIKNPKTNKYDTFFTVSKLFKKHNLLLTSSNPLKIWNGLMKKWHGLLGEYKSEKDLSNSKT